MRSTRLCFHCKSSTMDFVRFADHSFCDGDCLARWVLEHPEEAAQHCMKADAASADELISVLLEAGLIEQVA